MLTELETIAKILSLTGIPIILAIVGWLVNKRLATNNLSKDYVQLAISILKEPANDQNREIREWAIKVLAKYSPIPFSSNVETELKANAVITGPVNFSPDGRRIVAREEDGTINLWDVDTGALVMKLKS